MKKGSDYLAKLAQRLSGYFDVETDKILRDRKVDIFAAFRQTNEKYFFTRSIRVYGYNNYEYCIVQQLSETGQSADIAAFTGFLTELAEELVRPSAEHMSTYFTGILVSETGFSPEAVAAAQRFVYARNFAWGWRGWCDIRLILVDLGSGEVYANRKGKGVMRHYRP